MKNLLTRISFYTLLGMPLLGFSASSDTTRVKVSHAFSIETTLGTALKTNNVSVGMPNYMSTALRYCVGPTGENWEDIAYNMPYYGIGLYTSAFYSKSNQLGNPFSLYAIGGATIHQFTHNMGLNYEWNLGLSMGWKPFDPLDNPHNDAIGTESNVHLALKINWEFNLPYNFDLTTGLSFTHFSNGASKHPNKGMNFVGLYADLIYKINRPDKKAILSNTALQPPEIPKHLEHDLSFIISSRQIEFPTGTGPNDLQNQYIDKSFKVLGVAYSPTISKGYRYKWGPQIDIVYDESSQAKASREMLPDSSYFTRVTLAPMKSRFSIGFSLKGEISHPVFSFFANLGYTVLHQHHIDERFFQVIGVKVYLKDNLYGTFGIRATEFSVAQYLYWSFGYTIGGKAHSRRN